MIFNIEENKTPLKTLNEKIDLKIHNIVIEDNIHTLNTLKNQNVKVDMIYIDPPYNTKKTVLKYKDNRKTIEWISFMYHRLIAAKEILSEKGVILISIDDNHYSYLKILMDEIFGIKNFVANFIWKKSHTVKNDKSGISTQQEYVLCFAIDVKKMFYNKEKTGEDYIRKAYCHYEGEKRFRTVPLHKEKNKNSFEIKAPNGKIWVKKWNYNQEGINKLREDDMLYWGKDGNACPTKKVYLKKIMEKSFGSIIPEKVGYTGDGKKDLKNLGFTGDEFLYAKPVKLIEYFLDIFSHKDSVVLDFFAGTGTTGEAVINKNISDSGNRRFILGTNNEANIASQITIPRISAVLKKNNLESHQITVYNEENFNE